MPKPLKWYRSLAEQRVRRTEGVFLVEGPRAVSEVLRAQPDAVTELLLAQDTEFVHDEGVPVRALPRRQLDSLCPSVTPQGVLAVVRTPEGAHSGQLPGSLGGDVLLCEGVQDPGNLGTLVRTAAGFGFGGVVLSDTCADPFGPKAVQATAGSVLSLWIRRGRHLDMAEQLKQNGYRLVATHVQSSEGPEPFAGPGDIVLAVGSEGRGLSKELSNMADAVLALPVDRSRVESLNVAAAGAVCMYLARGRRSPVGR